MIHIVSISENTQTDRYMKEKQTDIDMNEKDIIKRITLNPVRAIRQSKNNRRF